MRGGCEYGCEEEGFGVGVGGKAGAEEMAVLLLRGSLEEEWYALCAWWGIDFRSGGLWSSCVGLVWFWCWRSVQVVVWDERRGLEVGVWGRV